MSGSKKNKIIAFSFVIVAFVLSFLIYDFTYGLNGQKFSIYTSLKNFFGSITENTSIVNGSFEENVIDSNYERISVNGWYTPKNDNKIAVAKYKREVDTKYFAELCANKSNSLYRNLILEKNTNYKFTLSHRGRTDADKLKWYDYDVLAIVLGSNQDISPSLDSNDKDQFMKMTEWLKTSYNTDIASNSISSKYTIYSSKFSDDGAFEVEGFSLTETEIYTEKWNIWFVKSSMYSFHDYTVDFNSEEFEDCLVSLSSVFTFTDFTKRGDSGNLIRKFKLYNEDDVLFDFDPEKIYQENKGRLTALLSRGYTNINALNTTNPFLTDDWWNVTETEKVIEFGAASDSVNPYNLVDLYNNIAFEGNQFAVADNIYQKINIGNNSALKLSFVYKSLSDLRYSLNGEDTMVDKQISIFNDTLAPSQNNDTKKTQLDLLSEWISPDRKRGKSLIVYTAPFTDNGLFTVDVSNAFSYTKDDIHTIPIYYLSYSVGYTNNSWVDFDTVVDLSDTGIDGNIVLYFNSYTLGDESIIIDDVKMELYENRKMFLDSEFDGEGTKESPYLINNEDDFIKLRSYALGLPDGLAQTYFKQTQDIIFTKNLSFKLAPNFAGIYDGCGYYLRDININNGRNKFIITSLFDTLTGTIENLGLINEVLNGFNSSGIAHDLVGGNIRNCYVTDSTFDGVCLSGIVNFIYKNSKVSNSYFYGTFKSAQNITGIGRYINSNVTFENVFSNIDPNIKASNSSMAPPTIINSSTKTLDEMKNVSFINTLNDYVQNNDSLVAWVIDQDTGLPVLSHEAIIPKVSNMYVKMSEDGSNNIYWYNKDNEYFLYLSKNIDRSSMITNFILNSDAIEVYAYDEDDNELGKIENDIPNNYFVKDKVILKLKYKNQMSGNYKVNVMQSDLPSVHLNLNPTETKTAGQLLEEINADRNHDTGFPGVAYIRDDENNLTTASFKKMKGRGNYTWTNSKKPYQVKFDSEISMLGMKPSKTWLFITNYTDGSLSRSAVFYKLAQELGIDYAVEFETADVYINGKYNGTYLVTSKVERGTNRVDITKNDSLIEMDNYADTYQVVSSISKHKFTIKYPDLEDATEEETNQKLQLNKELIDNLENKIYDQNVTYEELSQIIDLESFAKAYWVFEISENYDAMYGSTYIYTKDNLVHMGPMWDFDNTLNMISKNNTSLTDYYLLGSKGGAGDRRVRWFNQLMKRQEFSDLIDKIFLDNIQTFKNLATSTDDYINKINKSALMNYSRWPYDVMKSEHSYYMGGDSFEEASTNLISSINTRVDFYLNEYKSLRIKELKYETKDVNNNKITGTINLDSSGAILLPNTISSNAEIVLSGSTDTADNVEFTTISLSDGTYKDKLYLSNNVSVVCDKKVNRSSYNLFFEKEETNIIELQVATSPTKTEYYEGQVFDKTGMIINAIYTDNTSKKITTYSVSSKPLTIKDTSVTVTYQNFTVSVPITVKENSLVDLKIKTKPDKLKYEEGEKFNPEGMIIMATYEDGSEKEVKDYTYSKKALSLSDKKVIISYQSFTVEVNIEVNESPLKEVVIKTNPSKLKYTEGEVFNPSGMIVIAVMKNGKEVEITDYTYPTNALTMDNKVIYIEYNGKKVPLTLTITKQKQTQPNTIQNNDKKKDITEYRIVTGENQTLTIKGDTTLDIEVNEKPDFLEKVSINGNPLSETEYSVYGETLMIRIHNDYLKSLEKEENTIEITLKNGKILSTKFFINKEEEDKSQHNTSTDVDDITDSIDDKEFVEEKENKFNLKWLYGLIIIPVIFVIVLLKSRKKAY